MPKFLRYEKARASLIYRTICEAAAEDLTMRGHFSKCEVLDRVNFSIGVDVRWPYIKRMIEETHATELVRLTPSYFKRHAKKEEAEFTAHFVAVNDSTAAGYAIASQENGHFVRHLLKNKIKAMRGMHDHAATTVAIGNRLGIAGMGAPRLTDQAD